jgi:hypothetical protein
MLLLPDAIVERDIDLYNPVSLIPSIILAERDLFEFDLQRSLTEC